MRNFIKWCVCVVVVAWGGLDAVGQDFNLTPDRIMLFNNYPGTISNPGQSYYNTTPNASGVNFWTHDTSRPTGFGAPAALLLGTNHVFTVNTDGGVRSYWKFTDCRLGTAAAFEDAHPIPPFSTDLETVNDYDSGVRTNWMANMRNTAGAMIETPFYPHGVGTLYFDAINVFTDYPNELIVEIATNMVDHYQAHWTFSTTSYWDSVVGSNVTMVTSNVVYDTISTLYPDETPQFSNLWEVVDSFVLDRLQTNSIPYRFQATFNYRHPVRFRIRKPRTYSSGGNNVDQFFIAVDNIRVSRPPSDLMFTEPDVVYTPGYPSIHSNFFIRCAVSNLGTNDYEQTRVDGGFSRGRSVTLHYRWRYLEQASNDWQEVTMEYENGTGNGRGNGEVWRGLIPAQRVIGDLEYYFTGSFGGYRYNPRDYTVPSPGTVVPLDLYWPEPEYSETLSPRTYRGDTLKPDNREFYVRLRPFPSSFDTMSVVTGPPFTEENPIPMTLVSNGIWRGLVPIHNGGFTNLHFYFKGEREYNAGNGTISRDAAYWSELSQALVGTVPFGGVCEFTNAPPRSNAIEVNAEGGGYVQVVFDMNEMTYMTTRAEYQNFNDWPAPPDVFTDTNGQATKRRYDCTFDAWPIDGIETNRDVWLEYFVGYPEGHPTQAVEYVREPFETYNGWLAGSAAIVSERISADVNNRPLAELDESYRNVALRLHGGAAALGLGYVHNKSRTLVDGLEKVSFKARLGQPLNPLEAAYYIYGFTNRNYAIHATLSTGVLSSPERPSISLFGYYQSYTDFYELRCAQELDAIPTNQRRDERVRFSLYKWRNGIPQLLKTMVPDNVRLVLKESITVEMRLYNRDLATTYIRCKVGTTDLTDLNVDDSNSPLQYGTFGFMSADCTATITTVEMQPTRAEAALTGSWNPVFGSLEFGQEWVLPAGRWKANTINAAREIQSVTPVQNIGVYLQKAEFGTDDEPAAPGTQNWKLFKEVPVTGFEYPNSAYEVPIHMWRSHFVMLQVMGRTNDSYRVDIAVDELEISSWRGQESSDLTGSDTETSNLSRNTEWVAKEAWVRAWEIAGLSEGRVPGDRNWEQRNPCTSVQQSTRYANMTEGWLLTNTYVYSGWIHLNGLNGTNWFANNFAGNMQLKINGSVVLTNTTPYTVSSNQYVTGSSSNGVWRTFELRLGFGADGNGGPLDSQKMGGYGVVYSRDHCNTWRPIDNSVGTSEWLTTEDKRVYFDHTQQGRDILYDGGEGAWIGQAVRSPLLNPGAGLMEFDYQVLRGPAKLTVQYAPSADENAWTDVRSWVVSNAMTQFSHEMAYLGTNRNGYLRVLNDRGEDGAEYTNALVVINNATVWDEPDVDDASWRSYNMKITDTDPQRIMLDESKAGFLNSNQYAETDPVQNVYNQSFIKSPLLPTGLGSLSFMARAYTNGQSATLMLFVTTSPDGPRTPDEFSGEDGWDIVQVFQVTNSLYTTYTYTPADGREIRAFKLAVPTTGGGTRVCVEELAVSEPVLPGFEIAGVIPMCIDGNEYNPDRRQPLFSDWVGFQAQISNIRQKPQNIQLHVSYYVGTNYWGVDNWPAGATVTVPMVPYGNPSNLIYRTTAFSDIMPQEKNSVVQYYVWAEYEDENGMRLTTRQKGFDNPGWYYPVDLNKTFEAKGWSPYYIVYDVSVGAVWLNEINAGEDSASPGNLQYVEIAAPAGFDMAGWKLDFVQNTYVPNAPASATSTTTIADGLPASVEVTNGYAFIVVGPYGESLKFINQLGMPQSTTYIGVMSLSGKLSNARPGGLRLRRPLGMYEHLAAYTCRPRDWGTTYDGEVWAASDPEGRFEYVGFDRNENATSGGSLGVTNTPLNLLPRPSDWEFSSITNNRVGWTPGLPNFGQNVPHALEMAPGVANYLVTSTITTSLGTQNGGTRNPLSFLLREGYSTNILYEARNWYRLKSLTLNGEKQPLAGKAYNLEILGLATNQNISVEIGLRQDVIDLNIDDSDILRWLMGFEDAPLAPTWYYGISDFAPVRELSLTEKYWMNINPTVTNHLRGGIVKVEKDVPTTNFYVTVYLALNDTNITNLVSATSGRSNAASFKIRAKQDVASPLWSFVSQYSLTESSFDAQHQSRIAVGSPFVKWLAGEQLNNGLPQIKFQWVIEYDDPRIGKDPMVNDLTPVSP